MCMGSRVRIGEAMAGGRGGVEMGGKGGNESFGREEAVERARQGKGGRVLKEEEEM